LQKKNKTKSLPDYKIIFMGTPDFAVPTLKALDEANYQIIAVISQPNRAKGRKQIVTDTPVAAYANANNLKLLQPESINSEEMKNYLKESKVDLIITAAYGQIITEEILEIPTFGCINIHASLLPKYRGASPINAAIINAEEVTGITIMQMDKGMDTGDILHQVEIPIKVDETAGELFDRLATLGADSIVSFLPDFFDGNFKPIKQDESKASYAMKMHRDVGEIDWQKSASEISNLIRGTQPWPGSFTFFDDKRVKVFSAIVISQDSVSQIYKPGELISCDDGFTVQCGKDALKLGKIQFASGKKMDSSICSHNYEERQKFGRVKT